MNMQAIQIMILLLDSFIKLAPWRIVTETMDRIGCSASESLARSLVVIAAALRRSLHAPGGLDLGPLASDLLRRCDSFIASTNQRPAVQPRPVCILSWRDGVERVLAA